MQKNQYNYIPLQEPISIINQKWPEGTLPLVSSTTNTYNQRDYIEKCIEGILLQKTTFPVRMVIFDDASTDGTREIIQKYEAKYPQLIKGFYPKKNTYKKPERKLAFLPRDRVRNEAKYIAYCEGDDYWTDPLKLQKQVDFMEANPDCSLCFTRVKVKEENKEDRFYGDGLKKEPVKYSLRDFIKTNNSIGVRTVSMMFKSSDVKEMPKWYSKSPIGDLALQLYLGTKGSYGYLPQEMAVYNRGNPGAWSANNHSVEWRIRQIEHLNEAYELFDQGTNGKYHQLVRQRNKKWILSRIEYVQQHFDRKDQSKIIFKYLKYTLPFDKRRILIWMRFVLGNKTVNKLL